jgi:hypothetical protein
VVVLASVCTHILFLPFSLPAFDVNSQTNLIFMLLCDLLSNLPIPDTITSTGYNIQSIVTLHLRGQNKSIHCLLIMAKLNLKFQLRVYHNWGNTSSGLQQFNHTIFMQVGREEELILCTNIFLGIQYFT